MLLTEEIKEVLSLESTKMKWRNNHSSVEFKKASSLSFAIMGQHLNKMKNCGCLEDLFIMLKSLSKDKINLKQEQMESKFKFKEGTLITVGGTHYANANLTDEKAIHILKQFPSHIASFTTHPDNWKELCAVEVKTKKVVKEVIEEAVEESNDRMQELYAMTLPDLFAIAQELADENEDLKMPGARSKEAKLVSFIIDNE